MPQIRDALGEFDQERVEWIAVNLQEDEETAAKALERIGVSPRIAFDIDGAAAEKFQVTAIPHTAVVDPKGKITAVFIGSSPSLSADLLRGASPRRSNRPRKRRTTPRPSNSAASTPLPFSRISHAFRFMPASATRLVWLGSARRTRSRLTQSARAQDDKKYKFEPGDFDKPGQTGFFLLPADGGDAKPLGRYPQLSSVGSPAYSPDGKWIAFDAVPSGDDISGTQIVVAKADGSEARSLGAGLMPSWSPDGAKIACSRYEEGSSVWTFDVETGKAQKIEGDSWGIQWSPDGGEFQAFSRAERHAGRPQREDRPDVRVPLRRRGHVRRMGLQLRLVARQPADLRRRAIGKRAIRRDDHHAQSAAEPPGARADRGSARRVPTRRGVERRVEPRRCLASDGAARRDVALSRPSAQESAVRVQPRQRLDPLPHAGPIGDRKLRPLLVAGREAIVVRRVPSA